MQHANTPTKYYTWDLFLEDFDIPELQGLLLPVPTNIDRRYYYHDSKVTLAASLSGHPHDVTDDGKEVQKFNEWRLKELSS